MAENEDQKIKITFDTNAGKAAQDTSKLGASIDGVESSQKKAGKSTKDLTSNLRDLDTPINGAISGFGGMLKAMWAIVANPLGAVLAAVVLVVVSLVAVFKTFQPLVDKVEQGVAALGATFNVIKNTILAVFTGATSLSNAFKGLGSDMNSAANEAMALTKAQQDLDDVMKSQEVTSAKNRAEINKLNVDLRNRTKTDKERLEIADQIVKKENADFLQRSAIVASELKLAQGAIALKAQFTEKEKKLLKETGDATKELAESRGGNYDAEFDALNKARLKEIALQDETTVNIEKAYSRRDKIEDDQAAKRETATAKATAVREAKKAADKKIQDDKDAAQKVIDDAEKERIKQNGIDRVLAEQVLRIANEDFADKTEEQKLATQKERALEEIEILRKKGIDVENLLILNARKFATLESELIQKKAHEQRVIDEKIAADKLISDEKIIAEQKRIDDLILAQAQSIQDSKLQIADRAVGFLSMIAGKNKALQRAAIVIENALGIGKSLIANSAANVAATSAGAALAIPTAGASVAAATGLVIQNNISTGIGIATSIAATAKALSALGGGGGISGGGGVESMGGTRTSARPSVAFNNTAENQIGQSVTRSQIEQPPLRVIVAESDITDAQKNVKVLVSANEF